jgi:translation elongation factor EF-G
VPLANMFGYATFLASLSGRRATVAMEFSHYDQLVSLPNDDDDDPRFRPPMGMRA